MSRTINLTWYDNDGNEVTHSFPAVNEVCDRCDGHGTYLNPSIGNHAYSIEEFYESFSDDEDRAEYFKRGGIYDVQCEQCHGANVVAVVDETHLSPADKEVFESYMSYETKVARWDAEDAAAYRMETGYRE